MYWPYGRVVSHLRVRNAGVTAQRLEAWLPSHVDEENEGGNGDSSDGDDNGDKEEDDWFAEWKRFELENRQVAAFFEDDLEEFSNCREVSRAARNVVLLLLPKK